jgi:hypothetical protein
MSRAIQGSNMQVVKLLEALNAAVDARIAALSVTATLLRKSGAGAELGALQRDGRRGGRSNGRRRGRVSRGCRGCPNLTGSAGGNDRCA